MISLRRIKGGVYAVTGHPLMIVRLDRDWDDERYSPPRRRHAFMWEISKQDRGSWTVGLIGTPTRTLREAREMLEKELAKEQIA